MQDKNVDLWVPNKWIAAILGILLQPIGLLYLGKLKWPIFYLLLGLIIV